VPLSFSAHYAKHLQVFYNKIKDIVITILLLSFAGLCYCSRRMLSGLSKPPKDEPWKRHQKDSRQLSPGRPFIADDWTFLNPRMTLSGLLEKIYMAVPGQPGPSQKRPYDILSIGDKSRRIEEPLTVGGKEDRAFQNKQNISNKGCSTRKNAKIKGSIG